MRRSTLATALVAVFISYLGAPAAVKAGGYIETDLVSNRPGAVIQDLKLVNGGGRVAGPTTPYWVSENGTGVATRYAGPSGGLTVSKNPLELSIPTCDDLSGHSGTPTGVVFNSTTGFVISKGSASAPARFLFATEDGTIVGWAPTVDPTHGIIAVPADFASPVNAVYKGLAIASTGGRAFLYAANFQTGVVDMYDANFHVVKSFTDPDAGAAFHPFNVAVIGDKLFVAFAVRNPRTGDNVPGKGSGIVSVFNLDGTFDRRLADGGHLKAPWGMALAPSSNFGPLAGKLWVGKFGDGPIKGFEPDSGGVFYPGDDLNWDEKL